MKNVIYMSFSMKNVSVRFFSFPGHLDFNFDEDLYEYTSITFNNITLQ